MKDHAQKGDKQKLPSQLPHLFNCTFVMVPYPTILCTIGLIPFRISLFINSMLCWCNFLCVVCDALYEQANLKVITCVQKLEIIRIFFHGDDDDDDDDDD